MLTEITCEKLESENILVTKLRPGGLATYTCPRGSELLGNATRTCLMSGEWSGAEPKCRGNLDFKFDYKLPNIFKECKYLFNYVLFLAMPCPAPPPAPNARIFPLNTTLSHNAQVEYHCVPGFTRLGSAISTCFEGKWSPEEAPSCVLQEKQSSLPVVLGSTFGILIVLLLIVGFLYLRHQSKSKPQVAESVAKETPMVMFEPHYYDNPTTEHIYEDLNERDSVVTINGVTVS